MERKIRIFLSYAREDRDPVKDLYSRLRDEGFTPWMDDVDLPPGMDWKAEVRRAIGRSDAVLVCLSRKSISRRGYVQREIQTALDIQSDTPEGGVFLIPVLLEPSEIPEPLRELQSVYLFEESGFERLTESLRRLEAQRRAFSASAGPGFRNLLLTEIELVNIRCFERFHLRFEDEDGPIRWAMVVGDNAAGKTTLLRSIALGLCGESDAVALMKEVPGEFVRRDAEKGQIRVVLREEGGSEEYGITTTIRKPGFGAPEIIRQTTDPTADFPWSEVFVCGYGTQRSAQAHASYEKYTVLDAVRSLFDYSVSLQNPELVLLRHEPQLRDQLERKLLKILMLDESGGAIGYPKSGLELQGPWGRLPFSVLSDGYRSTSQWVLDFVAWLIHAERLGGHHEIGGILLIDEIEQHLHPRWQRHIVQRLRRQFPKTQIIATTHTPLTASGVVDVDHALLLKLEQQPDGSIVEHVVDEQQLAGKRADQVLASEAFGLLTTRNPGSEDDLDRYAALLGKKSRTAPEEAELRRLAELLREGLSFGENEFELKVEQAVSLALEGLVRNTSPELLDFETKKQLREIFKPEEPSR